MPGLLYIFSCDALIFSLFAVWGWAVVGLWFGYSRLIPGLMKLLSEGLGGQKTPDKSLLIPWAASRLRLSRFALSVSG